MATQKKQEPQTETKKVDSSGMTEEEKASTEETKKPENVDNVNESYALPVEGVNLADSE
jgi:hypothetical protein